MIDTGTEVTIGNPRFATSYCAQQRQVLDVSATGVTGVTVKLQMALIPELQLGPVTLEVPVAFADVPPFKLFGLADEPALLLGTDLLETFRRVSLDFRARKVRFQLKRCDADGVVIEHPTSTIRFTRLSRRRRVERVRR